MDRSILHCCLGNDYKVESLEPSIAINEAIQLAKEFGSDASYKLINAILDAYNRVNNETLPEH